MIISFFSMRLIALCSLSFSAGAATALLYVHRTLQHIAEQAAIKACKALAIEGKLQAVNQTASNGTDVEENSYEGQRELVTQLTETKEQLQTCERERDLERIRLEETREELERTRYCCPHTRCSTVPHE